MEERSSVNNPRRNSDAGELSPTRFGEHGRKLSEVYGFIGSITIVVATGILIIWAYVPDSWLRSIGINYYPTRYRALPVPTYVMVTIVLAIGFYVGLNFLATPPPTTLKSMFDEISKELLSDIPPMDDDEQAIEPISEIGNNQDNEKFDDLK